MHHLKNITINGKSMTVREYLKSDLHKKPAVPLKKGEPGRRNNKHSTPSGPEVQHA